jgi:predicted XRE-type DNA-binding protein
MKTRSSGRSRPRTKSDNQEFKAGSGNVFADLGLANPDERLAKARLASAINAIIEQHGWTQAEAAKHLKTHQPVLSALRHGRLRSITYDRLVDWLVLLGQSVEIKVRPARDARVRVAVASS